MSQQKFVTAGTFSGLSRIALTAHISSHQGTRYQTLLDKIHSTLAERVSHFLLKSKKTQFKSMFDYDVIEGVSGIGRYLLFHTNEPILREALFSILQYLIELTQYKIVMGESVPGWYTPGNLQFTDRNKILYPNGAFNCGLAHGIPGPLSLLSLAKLHGIEADGQQEGDSIMTSLSLNSLYSTVSISNPVDSPGSFIGSGVILNQSKTAHREQEIYLVTNAHVLKDVQSIHIQNERINLSITLNLIDNSNTKTWICHPDPEIDIALIPLEKHVLESKKITYLNLDTDLLTLEQMNEKEIREGETLFFVGYPNGISSSTIPSSITRRGTISNFSSMGSFQKGCFLLEGSVMPGNSGGPVFWIESNSIHHPYKNHVYLVGVIQGYVSHREYLVNQQTGEPKGMNIVNSGLAITLCCDLIYQTLEAKQSTLYYSDSK